MQNRKKVVAETAGTVGALLLSSVLAATAAPVSRHGTVNFTGTVSIRSSLPKTAVINATAKIVGGGDRIVSITSQLKRNGDKAVLTATLSYSWLLDSITSPIGSHMLVDFEVSTPNGVFTQKRVTLPMPADGATTVVALPAAI